MQVGLSLNGHAQTAVPFVLLSGMIILRTHCARMKELYVMRMKCVRDYGPTVVIGGHVKKETRLVASLSKRSWGLPELCASLSCEAIQVDLCFKRIRENPLHPCYPCSTNLVIISSGIWPRPLYRWMRPETPPNINCLTSSSELKFISPGIVCFRHEAATANSSASQSAIPPCRP